MALKKEVENILNKQIEMEFDAAIVYYGMYVYFEQELWKGFAAWFRKHVEEELSHAARLIDHMLERGASPVIPAVKAPKVRYGSLLEALKDALAHEQQNTAGVHACLKAATKADDPATLEMLQWFVKEQVEEEQWATEYVQMVEKVEKSAGALYAFDREVGHRAEK
ncbi:MAG: ferritin [Kiritimatiellae bacterium]|nr:ferritin [Kiritimatiellia bacterium]